MDRSDLELLAYERQRLARLKDDLSKKQEYLEATMAYKEVQDAQDLVKLAQSEVSRVEELIRDGALVQYRSDGEKNPIDGIKIKEFSIIRILDENEAKRWATENAPGIVTLNKTKFNKAVKELELNFVQKDKEYRVQIASDLSEYENTEGDTPSAIEE